MCIRDRFSAKVEFKNYEDEDYSAFDEDEDEDIEDAREEYTNEELNNAATALDKSSAPDDIMIFIRMLRDASRVSAEFAANIVIGNGVLNRTQLNRLIKASQEELYEDMSRKLGEYVLRARFNDGQHLAVLQNDVPYVFNKTHWQVAGENFLKRLTIESFDKKRNKIAGEATVNEATVVNQAFQLMKMRRAFNDLRIINDKQKLSVINCLNGELWINSKDGSYDLKPHNPKSYLTSVLPIEYESKAKAPLWKRTLLEIFDGDKDMVRHVLEMLGYLLQPNKNIAAWWLLRGPGGDGKSTILEILGALLGGAILQAPFSTLSLGSSVYGNNHATESLVGKLVVAVEEIPVNRRLPEVGLKRLSERTTMEANPKGKSAYNFEYVGGLVMCTNHWPSVDDTSEGMKRRANVIPFSREFVRNGEADLERAAEIIENELPGVLLSCLKGLERLRKRGRFQTPEKCLQATAEWFDKSNSVNSWFGTYCKFKEGKRMRLKEVYDEYTYYCQLEGIDPERRKDFKEKLLNLKVSLRTSGTDIYTNGIVVKKLS